MTKAEERRKKREARKKLANLKNSYNDDSATKGEGIATISSDDNKIAKLLAKNEDDLLNFVVKVNKVYQEKLHRPAPFMTFVI